jgi:hypothetical protein
MLLSVSRSPRTRKDLRGMKRAQILEKHRLYEELLAREVRRSGPFRNDTV